MNNFERVLHEIKSMPDSTCFFVTFPSIDKAISAINRLSFARVEAGSPVLPNHMLCGVFATNDGRARALLGGTMSGPERLEVHYGFLSVFRNTTLPVQSHWKIRRYLGGIRKLKKLYFFELGNHKSLRVRGQEKLEVLQALGAAIDRANGKPMGSVVERPVNM